MAAAVPAAVDPLDELRTVLEQCGITTAAARDNLITNEGFTSIESMSCMTNDNDVNEMAKRSMARTAAEGRVNVGTVAIKRIQGLVFWIKDRRLRGLPITAAAFTQEEMESAMMNKVYRKELAEATEPSVNDLGKFNPDDFEIHEDAFVNLLASSFGVSGEPLRYVVRDEEAPDEFESEEQRRIYQIPLEGNAYNLDNASVFRKLKAFLVETPGYTWIESFNTSEDGRAAFLAWTGHYNGRGELSKRTAIAKARLNSLFYKTEQSMSFEHFSGRLKRIFQVLDKDEDERVSPRQQIEYLLKGIKTTDAELIGAKSIISSMYTRDFDGACAYFSREVSRLHGAAQLEATRNRSKKRGIYAFDVGGRGRGRFGGRYGGRGGRFGRGGGRSGRGGNQNQNSPIINGVNISDPNRNFSPDEWHRLGPEGRTQVLSARDRSYINRYGNQGGRGQQGTPRNPTGGRGRGNPGRHVSFVETDDNQNDTSQNDQQQHNDNNSGGRGDRGGRNGRGFGRGAYSGRN